MNVNTAIRDHLEELLSQAESEKEWWAKQKPATAEITEPEPVKEEEEPKSSPAKSTDDDAVIVDTPAQSIPESPTKSKKKGKGRK